MGQAKCFSCLSPKLQYQLRTYLLAKIAMGDTSITGVQALSVASTCFSCLTHGELLAAKQYLMAVWLGLDTTKTGIIAQAATAACDYACLTPVQAEQVRTYLLAVTAGVATDAAGVQALELAAKCFECPTNKRQLEMQVYLLSTLAPGAPTTASAIMQAAGCFLACVPPELHEAFQTSLFAQVAGRSTPPCVTPTAPGQPSAFSALNNILKISWTQPANSGSLIQSYTLSYGTTQGGPYTASVTVQAGTKQAILNGLTAGTTYYFVVTANSFSGCSSANSAEGSAATTGTPALDPLVTDWATRVHNNGDPTPNQSVQSIVNTFVTGLKAAGIDSLIYYDLICAPGGLITSLTPLHHLFGTDPAISGNVGTTVDASGFFQVTQNGIGTASSGIITGVNPTNVFTGTSMGLAIYQHVNGGGSAPTPAQWGGGGGGRFGYFWTTTLASYATFQLGFTNPFAVGDWGFWLGSRTGANQLDIYAANGTHAWSNRGSSGAAAAGVVPANGNISFYNNTVATFTYNFSINNDVSYLGIVQGMTSAQGQAYFNLVQAMRQSFIGGFT